MGHYRPLNHLAEWEIRLVCPIQPNFFIEANPNPFYQEISCDKGSSTSANELSRQWAVRPGTAHRL